jgi:hypothetical protein
MKMRWRHTACRPANFMIAFTTHARRKGMRFVLEVDLDAGALAGDDRAGEMGRILRYWGGAMKQVELTPGSRQDLYDSGYAAVGEWRIEET